MSAENELRVFPMENGEFWIGNRSCGDTVLDFQGKVHAIVAKAATYAEVSSIFARMSDETSEAYYPTEHGGILPSEDALAKEPKRLLVSRVAVKFGGRACDCVDLRDTTIPKWEVVEYGRPSWPFESKRTLADGLTYAEAIHIAHRHQMIQPGACTVHFPTFFRTFESDAHDCDQDHWSEIEVVAPHLKAFW